MVMSEEKLEDIWCWMCGETGFHEGLHMISVHGNELSGVITSRCLECDNCKHHQMDAEMMATFRRKVNEMAEYANVTVDELRSKPC